MRRTNQPRPPMRSGKQSTRDDWRAQLARNQDKGKVWSGGQNKKRQPTYPVVPSISIHFTPGIARTVFFLSIAYFVYQASAQPSVHVNANAVRKLARNKVVVEPSLSHEELKSLNPEKVIDTISNLVVINPSALPTVNRVLSDSKLSIFSITKKVLNEFTGIMGMSRANGFFSVDMKTLLLPADTLIESTTHHEMIHADWMGLHAEGLPCYEPNLEKSITPLFPVSLENIKIYEVALKKGLNRLREFSDLLVDEKNGLFLDNRKMKLLTKYKAVAKTCLLNIGSDQHPLSSWSRLVKAGWPDKKIILPYAIDPYEPCEIEVLHVERGHDKLHITYKVLDPSISLMLKMSAIDNYLHHLSGDAYSIYVRIAEADAHAFQSLSQQGIECFFPEAHQLRESVKRVCLGDQLKGGRLEL